MLAQTNWTGKIEFHQSERRAYWVYNEVILNMAVRWIFSEDEVFGVFP